MLAKVKLQFGHNHTAECAGPCVTARQGGFPVTCAPDGSFEPLQCQSVGDLFRCQCVNPSDGSVIVSTEVTVTNMDDAPDCDRLGEYIIL